MFRKSSKKQLKGQPRRIYLASAQLLEGNLHELVYLPAGEDANEWIALNTVEFTEQLWRVLGLFTPLCKAYNCEMTAGNCQYSWVTQQGRLYYLKAFEYFDETLNFCNGYLNNYAIFPLDFSTYFPKDFQKIVYQMFKRMFRCYAHCYSAHANYISTSDAGVINYSFQHLVVFAREFQLLSIDETEVVEDVLRQMNL